ncbi:Stk1 family PASTA domain-containing Ser/Thr kinase [Pseudonocardia sp. CA-107938]|uniref:Stk1 family PASTA domain-containing Ser/Thr kinase n=1 Tax=Pseudonocardia sp. CA-107938 TaxID=3240021 RepID=UPI003D8E1B4B
MNAPPATGTLLDGRYLLGPVIARGGMSVVHRGLDTRLDRPVAVKVMDPRLAGDPAFRARVEREARTAARIDHPAVVDVYDHGIDHHADPDGGPLVFLVMELVDGGTLRDVLRARGALGVPAAFAVMDGVLSGLAEAHRLGMVHRDVKPENVLISTARELRVADFGLVTAAAQAGQSHAGMIMGTAAYLSPEQVATGAADSRSDVYAAGILFYELLTGAPPYTGDTALSVAYRHVNADVPPPSLVAGDVPPELDELVVRATRRDPVARPADAAAMLAELHALAIALEVPRVPVPAPPPRPIEEQVTVPQAPRSELDGTARPATGTRALPRSEQGHTLFGEPVPDGPRHVRARRRSRRVFAIWIAIVLVIALALGLMGWWMGSGRWTAMPSLVGLDRTAAERALEAADLVGTVTTAVDDRIAAGVVTRTDPAPESRLLRGSTVGVVVSSGRPTVPTIAPGTTVAAAEQAVRAAGLQPVQASSREYSEAAPEGTVARTQPGAGTALAVGGTVTLVLSKGPEPEKVTVPRLVGLSYGEAKAALAELGLKAEESDRSFFGLGAHRVIRQDPRPGTEVEPGATVTLETI